MRIGPLTLKMADLHTGQGERDMRVKGMTEQQVKDIVSKVSAQSYEGNLTIKDSQDHSTSRTNHATFTLRVHSSRGSGARRSWNDRRTVSACWHAHWDVFRAMFDTYPDAVIRTSMATYTADTFEDRAESTRYQNVGSMMSPAYMADLCEC